MSGKFNQGTFDLIERGLPTNWQAMSNSTLSAWIKANPDIVRGDYHIFGNDKLALTRNGAKLSIVQSVPEKRCLFWNKMESLANLGSPEIGALDVFGAGSASITYTSVYFGNGSYHDGNTEWVRYSNAWDWAHGCVEFWYKPNFASTAGGFRHIINDTKVTDPVTAITHGNGGFAWWIYGVLYYGYTDFVANDIMHMAFTWDKTGINGTSDTSRIYRDGVIIASNSAVPSSTYSFSTAMHVGARSNGQEPALAAIDNLKSWNYAKTDFSDRFIEDAANFIEGDNGISIPGENQWYHMGCRINHNQTFDLFLDGEKVHSSVMKIHSECFEDLEEKFWPDHWWKFDEIAWTTAYDSGKAIPINGTHVGAVTVGANGKRGKCVYYSASPTDYTTAGTSRILNEYWTFACWVKIDTYPDGYMRIFNKEQCVFLGFMNTGDLAVLLGDGSPEWDWQNTDMGAIPGLDIWFHVIYVKDGTVTTTYINGVWTGKTLTSAQSLGSNPAYVNTFARQSNASQQELNGHLDDVRIFYRAFSAQESRQLYEYVNNYHVEQPRISIGETISGRISNPINWWKLNETSGTIAYDSAGSVEGTNTATEVGKLGHFGGCCYNFPSAGSPRIDISGVNPIIDGIQKISVSAWFLSYDVAGANDAIISLGTNWSNSHGQFDLIVLADTLSFRLDAHVYTLPIPFTDSGKFHHAIAVYDYVNMYLYLDGQLVDTVSAPTRLLDIDSFTYSFIGTYYGGSWSWYGKLQDVKIYDFAVTPTEARQLYNLGRTPNGEVCDIRYDRAALSDDEIKFLAESNRPTDPDQSAEARHIRL